jgi:hypothetical protein
VIEDFIENLDQDIESTLISPNRETMMVVTVEDWEA